MFAQDFGGLHYDVDWDLQATEWDWRGFSESEPALAPSEDFWKKFEELPELGEDLESLFENEVSDVNLTNVLMHHDCMWSGLCLNKDHKPENKPPPPPPPVVGELPPPVVRTVVNSLPAVTAASSAPASPKSPVKRSLLVHTKTPEVVPSPRRPDTPPSHSESEDEDKVQIPAGGPAPTVTGAIRLTIQTSAFDHNYDKTVRSEDYGLQTPSDSEEEQNQSSASEEDDEEDEDDEEEEEIDVVSLTRDSLLPTRDSLPTNPTREVRTQLQKKVASAISTSTLLNAKRAVSRRLKQTKKAKRKRTSSDEEESGSDFYSSQSQLSRNWRKAPKKFRFSDSEPDSEKRSIHNNMERMRRIDLRNSFEDLKGLLPSLADAQRAPKVTILKDATSYLHELGQKEKTLAQHVSKLRSHQEHLRSTLSRLRKTLAAVR